MAAKSLWNHLLSQLKSQENCKCKWAQYTIVTLFEFDTLPHKDALCKCITVVDGHTRCLGTYSIICHKLVINSLTEIYFKSPIWAEGVHSAPHSRKLQIYVSLLRCFIVSLFHCFVVSLSRCFIVSLFHFANYHKPWTGVHQRVIWLGVKIPIPGNIYMYMYSTVHCRLSTKIVRYVVYILQFFTLKFCPDSVTFWESAILSGWAILFKSCVSTYNNIGLHLEIHKQIFLHPIP